MSGAGHSGDVNEVWTHLLGDFHPDDETRGLTEQFDSFKKTKMWSVQICQKALVLCERRHIVAKHLTIN